MLFSAQANLAFAHFPKTAGTSIVGLLTGALPDARLIDPRNTHLDVLTGRARMRLKANPLKAWARRLKGEPAGPCEVDIPRTDDLRVLGIVREPFELCVSLFEYWNRTMQASRDPLPPLLDAAVKGDFDRFLRIAAEDNPCLPTFRQFYDFGGPLWPRTLLVDYAHLKEGLGEAFTRLGLAVDVAALPALNTNPRPPEQLQKREEEAGELADRIRKRFEWGQPVELLGRPRNAGGLA